jgi:hypothetical protein
MSIDEEVSITVFDITSRRGMFLMLSDVIFTKARTAPRKRCEALFTGRSDASLFRAADRNVLCCGATSAIKQWVVDGCLLLWASGLYKCIHMLAS